MYTNDLYQVLNLEPDASLKDIKKQFKTLSLQFHPDKLKSPTQKDTENYNLISLAYSVLSVPETRREYDQMYYIEKRSQTFENLKEKFSEFKNPQINTKEIHEEEIEARHSNLFKNFTERDYKSYINQREGQKKLEPISKSFDFEEEEEVGDSIITSNVPTAIVPESISKYQSIDKVGEMYSATEEMSTKPYILNVSTKGFQENKETNIKSKVSTYEKETETYRNLSATDYKKTGDLLLDKIIL